MSEIAPSLQLAKRPELLLALLGETFLCLSVSPSTLAQCEWDDPTPSRCSKRGYRVPSDRKSLKVGW